MIRVIIIVVIILVSAVSWFCAGLVVGMASFDYEGRTSGDLSAEEKEHLTAYSNLAFKIGGLWALTGALAGLVIAHSFLHRPAVEHTTPSRAAVLYPGKPVPKTVAEQRIIGLAVILGIVGALWLTKWYIPNHLELPTNTVARPGNTKTVLAVVLTAVISAAVMPQATKIIRAMRR